MANPYVADPKSATHTWTTRDVADLYTRIHNLEKHIHYPNTVKTETDKIEATRDLYAPLRSNADPLVRLAAFARRLLDPDDLGHAVSFEVRELAREALGKEKVG
jgi:hypothetical protein